MNVQKHAHGLRKHKNLLNDVAKELKGKVPQCTPKRKTGMGGTISKPEKASSISLKESKLLERNKENNEEPARNSKRSLMQRDFQPLQEQRQSEQNIRELERETLRKETLSDPKAPEAVLPIPELPMPELSAEVVDSSLNDVHSASNASVDNHTPVIIKFSNNTNLMLIHHVERDEDKVENQVGIELCGEFCIITEPACGICAKSLQMRDGIIKTVCEHKFCRKCFINSVGQGLMYCPICTTNLNFVVAFKN